MIKFELNYIMTDFEKGYLSNVPPKFEEQGAGGGKSNKSFAEAADVWLGSFTVTKKSRIWGDTEISAEDAC